MASLAVHLSLSCLWFISYLTAAQGCEANCTITHYENPAWGWKSIDAQETVTDVVILVYDEDAGTTETIYSSATITASGGRIGLPPTNAAGTVTQAVWFGSSSFLLTYPTQTVQWSTTYLFHGTLPTQTGGGISCIIEPSGTGLDYPAEALESLTQPPASFPTGGDQYGLYYTAYRKGTMLPQWWISALEDTWNVGAYQSCSKVGIAPMSAVQEVLVLTSSSVSTKSRTATITSPETTPALSSDPQSAETPRPEPKPEAAVKTTNQLLDTSTAAPLQISSVPSDTSSGTQSEVPAVVTSLVTTPLIPSGASPVIDSERPAIESSTFGESVSAVDNTPSESPPASTENPPPGFVESSIPATTESSTTLASIESPQPEVTDSPVESEVFSSFAVPKTNASASHPTIGTLTVNSEGVTSSTVSLASSAQAVSSASPVPTAEATASEEIPLLALGTYTVPADGKTITVNGIALVPTAASAIEVLIPGPSDTLTIDVQPVLESGSASRSMASLSPESTITSTGIGGFIAGGLGLSQSSTTSAPAQATTSGARAIAPTHRLWLSVIGLLISFMISG